MGRKFILKYSPMEIIKEYLILSFGILIYDLAWAIFLLPNNLVGGGVTGIGAIIYYGIGIPPGYTFFVLNIILIVIAMLVIGRGLGIKTIYAVIIASIGLNVLQDIIPYEIIDVLAIQNGKLPCSIMGAVLAGTGIGMSLSVGGSTGGTDIVALLVNKYKNVSPGKIIMISDILIILSSLLVSSKTADGMPIDFVHKLPIVIYGLIIVGVNSYVIDFYLSGSKQSVQIFILSSKYEEIADAISQDFHRGVTVINGLGWFTKKESKLLMVLARKTELNLLLKYIKSIDEQAFLSVSTVMGVFGQGFDKIKGNKIRSKSSISEKK